jgi:hypothetical protein
MSYYSSRPCACGSGETHYALEDARGIFCGYVCSKCEAKKRAQFRPDIFNDSNYWADEPIEAED